jgi:hypothetical protein
MILAHAEVGRNTKIAAVHNNIKKKAMSSEPVGSDLAGSPLP